MAELKISRGGDKILLMGYISQDFHVGYHMLGGFSEFSDRLLTLDFLPYAKSDNWINRKINWHFRGKTVPGTKAFSKDLVSTCREKKIKFIITAGLIPVSIQAVSEIKDLGIKIINFSTDDPWNMVNSSFKKIDLHKFYDYVFTPREVTIEQFRDLGCPNVQYLPFAFNPDIHKPIDRLTGPPASGEIDVYFAGGADNDRVEYFTALSSLKINIALQGSYWNRVSELKQFDRGFADSRAMQLNSYRSKINIGLVRKANRDSHAMRSYEVPAYGGFFIVQDTVDHRRMFGSEGECVAYFSSSGELVEKVNYYLQRPDDRIRMADRCHEKIFIEENTYTNRVTQMVNCIL